MSRQSKTSFKQTVHHPALITFRSHLTRFSDVKSFTVLTTLKPSFQISTLWTTSSTKLPDAPHYRQTLPRREHWCIVTWSTFAATPNAHRILFFQRSWMFYASANFSWTIHIAFNHKIVSVVVQRILTFVDNVMADLSDEFSKYFRQRAFSSYSEAMKTLDVFQQVSWLI